MIRWTACRTVLRHDAVTVCLLQEHVMRIFNDIVMEYRRYITSAMGDLCNI